MKENNIRKTSIIILTYNNLEYNKNCIESIKKYTQKDTYEIIVIDNNSSDGTREWLKTEEGLKIILNDYNAGFPKGCNMGIAAADKENDILLLNNDTVVTTRWLENLQICLYSDEKIGATGAVCNHSENLQGVDFSYQTLEEMQILAEKNNISSPSRWEEKIFLIGFCILIKREVINKIGMLDEMFSPGYVEDNDLSLRIIMEGYKLMLCHDAFIHHYLGTEFRKDVHKFRPVLFKNREIFRRKWGFETFAFDDIRFDLMRLIDEADSNKEINILELGCGLGVTLLKIKNQYPQAKLYGIEPNENMCRVTQNFMRVSSKVIGSFPLEFPKEYFDYILIGNSLENVEKPEYLLKELRTYLKKGGYIIGAVQNIMHHSVLKNLLMGNWRYREGDTLRKENRTYFTLNDIHRLFYECGYKDPFIFHWFSILQEEDKKWIENLCAIQPQRDYLYSTYAFSVRFQKG